MDSNLIVGVFTAITTLASVFLAIYLQRRFKSKPNKIICYTRHDGLMKTEFPKLSILCNDIAVKELGVLEIALHN